eukprot:s4386_g1.t1
MSHELGNALFAVVEQVQPELAPKLTGMLLQLGENECWACLEDHEKLAVRLDEAMAILDGAQPKQEAPRAKAPAAERREYWEHCKSTAAAPTNGTAVPKKAAAKEPDPRPVAKAPSTPVPAPKPAAAKPTPKPAAPKAAAPAPVLAPRKPAKDLP